MIILSIVLNIFNIFIVDKHDKLITMMMYEFQFIVYQLVFVAWLYIANEWCKLT